MLFKVHYIIKWMATSDISERHKKVYIEGNFLEEVMERIKNREESDERNKYCKVFFKSVRPVDGEIWT